MAALEGIPEEINIGLLRLRQDTFEETIIPVCRALVTVLERHLPKLAIIAVAQTQEKLEEIMVKIENYPDDTMSYVYYLRYLEQCTSLIEKTMLDLKYPYDVFVLMKDFNVPVDIGEKDKYLDVEEYSDMLKNTVDDKLASRDEMIKKLADLLQTDIQVIFDEVDDIMVKAVEGWLISEDSNVNTIKDTLQGLNERLTVCQGLSQDYRKYQREFKVIRQYLRL